MNHRNFDIIVVGAGHAGIEAALSSARLGLSVCVVTTQTSRIGYMSCNPSIGGLAKGHMVREIDILGGEMGAAADYSCLQFKRLNSGKGPAVRGTRMQTDKVEYAAFTQNALASHPHIQILESEAKKLLISGRQVQGIVLADGSEIFSAAVILTTGTFMNGVMHVGQKKQAGGRIGDDATTGLSQQMQEFGFSIHRLKTGTPARLYRESIDWTKTQETWGDENYLPFSIRSPNETRLKQVPCYLSKTTCKTHDIIRKNLHLSPMYAGDIEGIGPRYCPSIEDKIVRFHERPSHQTFLEPESLSTNLIYLQGISTSLPESIQQEFLETIPGLENVRVARYGYAVEYDFVEPTQIWHTLESRPLENLFLAGQMNGTSGYEEAAAQGFLAGVNAAHKILNKSEFILRRDEAYMGVLIDDLVTKGTREPYRMFTSRAEHRLVLREDNSIARLFERSKTLSIHTPSSLEKMEKNLKRQAQWAESLQKHSLYPNEQTQQKLRDLKTSVLLKSITFNELLRRPEMNSSMLAAAGFPFSEDPSVTEPVEIEVKYKGYIDRQNELISKMKKFEELLLPEHFIYEDVRGLSREETEKLSKVRPRTIAQAGRISGINPSAIQSLMIHMTLHPLEASHV